MKSEVILIFFILNGLLIVSSESEFETTTLNPETTTEPITTEIATETTSELTTQTTEKSTTILVSKIAKLSAILSTTTTTTLSPPTTTTSAPSNFITSTIESLRKFFFSPQKTSSYDSRRQSTKLQARNQHENKTIVITKRMSSNIEDEELFCPQEKEATFELFPTICNNNQECESLGKKFRCCKLFGSQRCHEGLEKPLEDDLNHEPLFGIPRRCPKEPLAESFWDVKKCDEDSDCDFPRICCPSGRKRYCMTSYTEPEQLPVGRQIAYPVESISQYFQCTPPPPLPFDRHPKPCNSSLTCFPNICCLEGGKKHCRPPKRNILAALTTFSQRFNVGWIREWTENLVIRR